MATQTFWKSGDGDPYNGGRLGIVTVNEHFTSTQGRPDDAVDIAEAEYLALKAAFDAEWESRAIGGQAFVDAEVAQIKTTRTSAVAKLQALGLTEAEARAIVGAY